MLVPSVERVQLQVFKLKMALLMIWSILLRISTLFSRETLVVITLLLIFVFVTFQHFNISTTPTEVKQLLSELNVHKSCGPDDISPMLFKIT